MVVDELGQSRIVDYEGEGTNPVRLEFEGISQASREEALVLRVGGILFEASASDRCCIFFARRLGLDDRNVHCALASVRFMSAQVLSIAGFPPGLVSALH